MVRKKATARKRVHEQTGLPSSLISDASARLTVSPAKVRTALAAAQRFSDEEFGLVHRFLRLREKGVSAERRHRIAQGIVRAIDMLAEAQGDDPLAEVDAPQSPADAVRAVAEADAEARATREAFLRQSISVEEAARRVGRSRQSIEAMRRAGKAIAFRVRNQWRYPEWQFDPDAPGGILPGVAPVLRRLGLPPLAAALWLTQPKEALEGRTPLEILGAGRVDDVVALAEEHAHLP